jgi:stress-induced morphogen
MMLRPLQRVGQRPSSCIRAHRFFATTAEESMKSSLLKALNATHVKVDDISGGCGSMYKIEVVSPSFVGKSRVMQHRMVNDVLKEEIVGMHGLTLKTFTPDQYEKA